MSGCGVPGQLFIHSRTIAWVWPHLFLVVCCDRGCLGKSTRKLGVGLGSRGLQSWDCDGGAWCLVSDLSSMGDGKHAAFNPSILKGTVSRVELLMTWESCPLGGEGLSSEHLLKRAGWKQRDPGGGLTCLFNTPGFCLLITDFILCFQRLSSL